MTKFIMATLVATMAVFAGGDIAPVAAVAAVEAVEVFQSKDFYVGISTTLGDSIAQTDYTSFSSTGYGVQAGWTFYRAQDFTTSLEARYTTIVTGDSFGDIQTYGAFIKPQYNFGMASVYGLVGYTRVDNVVKNDGFAYGVGISTEVQGFEVFVDYVTNDDNSFKGLQDWKFNNEVVSVGVNYRF